MYPLEVYLQDICQIHTAGSAPETSYYPALAKLLNELGKTLQPPVTCITHPKGVAGNLPDAGFYTRQQVQKSRRAGEDGPMGQKPERGCMEVKSPAKDVLAIAASKQVGNYREQYGQVLVTNLRD